MRAPWWPGVALTHMLRLAGARVLLSGGSRGRQAKHACGIVMMSWGQSYTQTAIGEAARVRALPAEKGWCPLDPQLDHVPVALFTDVPEKDLEAQAHGVEIHSEKELPAWTHEATQAPGTMRAGQSQKMKWYHPHVILKSPYTLTLYLDVDAQLCSAGGFTRLATRLLQQHAHVGALKVAKNEELYVNGDELPPGFVNFGSEKKLWSSFHEYNSGVMMVDTRRAWPVLAGWARAIERTIHRTGRDQYGLREALFMNRRLVKHMSFDDAEVCRYVSNTCTDGKCAVDHHRWNAVKQNVQFKKWTPQWLKPM